MIRIEVDDRGLRQFAKKVKVLTDGKWKVEAFRGLDAAGRKTKTQVQRAVHGQMAMKSYQFVSGSTRGVASQGELTYHISSVKGGQRIEEYKGLKSVKSGRLASLEAGGVSSAVWNRPRIFQRSFATEAGYFAMLPGEQKKQAPRILWTPGAKDQARDAKGRFADMGRTYGPIRRLFGPALRDEIVKDDSRSTFEKVAPVMLEQKVVPRLAKLMKF